MGHGDDRPLQHSQTSTPPGLCAHPPLDGGPPWSLQVPREGAQRLLLLPCLWSASLRAGVSLAEGNPILAAEG